MDHIVYLDAKAKELENLKAGVKTMIARGAMGRKLPHGRVHAGDIWWVDIRVVEKLRSRE